MFSWFCRVLIVSRSEAGAGLDGTGGGEAAGAVPPGSIVPGVLCGSGPPAGGSTPPGGDEATGPGCEAKCTPIKTAASSTAEAVPAAHVHAWAVQKRCGASGFWYATATGGAIPAAPKPPLAGILSTCGIGAGAPGSGRASRILIVPAR